MESVVLHSDFVLLAVLRFQRVTLLIPFLNRRMLCRNLSALYDTCMTVKESTIVALTIAESRYKPFENGISHQREVETRLRLSRDASIVNHYDVFEQQRFHYTVAVGDRPLYIIRTSLGQVLPLSRCASLNSVLQNNYRLNAIGSSRYNMWGMNIRAINAAN